MYSCQLDAKNICSADNWWQFWGLVTQLPMSMISRLRGGGLSDYSTYKLNVDDSVCPVRNTDQSRHLADIYIVPYFEINIIHVMSFDSFNVRIDWLLKKKRYSPSFTIIVLFYEEFEDNKGGNQNPYIEEEQTTQWPKEKVQKDKQRSTKHYTEN